MSALLTAPAGVATQEVPCENGEQHSGQYVPCGDVAHHLFIVRETEPSAFDTMVACDLHAQMFREAAERLYEVEIVAEYEIEYPEGMGER